jgi:hypothetical protein
MMYMKLGRILLAGVVYFVLAFLCVVGIVFARCLIVGARFDLHIAVQGGIRTGIFVGVVMMFFFGIAIFKGWRKGR